MKNIIIPAILVKDFDRMHMLLERAAQVADRVQIDICDGQYVASKTWPFSQVSRSEFIAEANSTEDIYLPFWEELEFIADLMCERPSELLETLFVYGFSEVVLHFRSLQKEYEERKAEFEDFESYIKSVFDFCKKYEVTVALAADLATDFEEFLKVFKIFKDDLAYVQFMGIAKIGYQGQRFDERVIGQIEMLKEISPKTPVCIDGGMDGTTILHAKDAGAGMFVVGSALDLDGDEYIFNYKEFTHIQ